MSGWARVAVHGDAWRRLSDGDRQAVRDWLGGLDGVDVDLVVGAQPVDGVVIVHRLSLNAAGHTYVERGDCYPGCVRDRSVACVCRAASEVVVVEASSPPPGCWPTVGS